MRTLKISMKRMTGTINELRAWVNERPVIGSRAPSESPTWQGDIPDEKVSVEVEAFGIGRATYQLGIDLPGTVDDQQLELSLQGGYNAAKFEV